jgi:hypothetical protein
MLSRKRIEIVIAVLILIGLLILLWFVLRKPKTPEAPVIVPEQQITQTVPEVNPASVPAPGVVSASTVARTFIERFGSYSSETNFANVDDIMALATPGYQEELRGIVAGYRRQFANQTQYTGVSTYVISVKTSNESDSTASFLITTQREEAVGTPGNTTVRYQDADISLIKSGDNWLIDDLRWQ